MELNGKSISNKTSILNRVKNSSSLGDIIIILVMCTLLMVAVGNKFLSIDNLISVCRQFSFYAIMAIGMCCVIITGGIDLSVGSVFAFSGVVTCMAMTDWKLSVFSSVLIGCISGLAFGFLNGLFITKLELPPFIATLGTMSIARGLSYGITGGYPIGSLPDSFKFIGLGYIANIPTPIVLMIVLAMVFSFFLRKTIAGRWVYAVGGNEEAARISGIKVDAIKILVY